MTVTKPILTSVGETYQLYWEVGKIIMQLSRIIENNRETSAEITISLNSQPTPKHIHRARLNILSTIAKRNLAKELEGTKMFADLEWRTMIEQASMLTLAKFREGAPVIKIGSLPRRETPRFRLKPFIIENELTAIFAHGGKGKSRLAIFMGILIQCGVCTLGFNPIKGNVLYLDWESTPQSMDEVVKAIKFGMSIESDEEPYYRQCHRLLASEIDEVQRQVMGKDIKLVIIDSAGMAGGVGADFHNPAMELLRALRSLKISVLLIDHKPKDSESMFGSVYKTNECRATFEIQSYQEEGSNTIDMAIYHRKANDTTLFKPMGFVIEFQGTDDYTEEIIFREKPIEQMSELSNGLSLRQQLENILKDETVLTEDELSEITGKKQGSIRTTLYRCKKTFVKTGGKWGLVTLNYEE